MFPFFQNVLTPLNHFLQWYSGKLNLGDVKIILKLSLNVLVLIFLAYSKYFTKIKLQPLKDSLWEFDFVSWKWFCFLKMFPLFSKSYRFWKCFCFLKMFRFVKMFPFFQNVFFRFLKMFPFSQNVFSFSKCFFISKIFFRFGPLGPPYSYHFFTV